MNDELESQEEEHSWRQGKPASELPSSDGNMDNDRKEIIRRALDFDIIDIRSFTGYKGDPLVEITTLDYGVVQALQKSAEELGFDTVIQKNKIEVYQLFCITPATDIYDLKE